MKLAHKCIKIIGLYLKEVAREGKISVKKMMFLILHNFTISNWLVHSLSPHSQLQFISKKEMLQKIKNTRWLYPYFIIQVMIQLVEFQNCQDKYIKWQ